MNFPLSNINALCIPYMHTHIFIYIYIYIYTFHMFITAIHHKIYYFKFNHYTFIYIFTRRINFYSFPKKGLKIYA